ncbi:hypothetical protein [Christiangramia sediminis]|uniref:Uncharacterized protein n=1 Tax=Christiangramia sediminis TaxID=2881336 RepID=A0A9X1RYJ1_9FLAO|nr:hypothetical protein [Christiangramia sediminis]MCB7481759.1 hypothetical protein [Christiangramia sediminis]
MKAKISNFFKVYFAVFLACLYLLAPLNEEILSFLHKSIHQLEERQSNIDIQSPSDHSISHTHSFFAPNEHSPNENSHQHKHLPSHDHQILELINKVFKISPEKQQLPEEYQKKNYDKHFPKDSYRLLYSFEKIVERKRTYFLKSYFFKLEIPDPPPQILLT